MSAADCDHLQGLQPSTIHSIIEARWVGLLKLRAAPPSNSHHADTIESKYILYSFLFQFQSHKMPAEPTQAHWPHVTPNFGISKIYCKHVNINCSRTTRSTSLPHKLIEASVWPEITSSYCTSRRSGHQPGFPNSSVCCSVAAGG